MHRQLPCSVSLHTIRRTIQPSVWPFTIHQMSLTARNPGRFVCVVLHAREHDPANDAGVLAVIGAIIR